MKRLMTLVTAGFLVFMAVVPAWAAPIETNPAAGSSSVFLESSVDLGDSGLWGWDFGVSYCLSDTLVVDAAFAPGAYQVGLNILPAESVILSVQVMSATGLIDSWYGYTVYTVVGYDLAAYYRLPNVFDRSRYADLNSVIIGAGIVIANVNPNLIHLIDRK